MNQKKAVTAILFGVGALAISSLGYAIRAYEPPKQPMPQGTLLPGRITDFTPKAIQGSLDPSSYLHPTSKVIGDVRIGASTWIGPRASLRADLGHNIVIGANCNVQDAVVIWGAPTEAEGKPLPRRDARELYLEKDPKAGASSVIIEENVSIFSQAQIVGPSLIGANASIGAGALVYQSSVGEGSIIEAGAQLFNVQIPPNSYVAAGQIISNTEIAKRLPTVDAAQSSQSKAVSDLYARLTRGYLGQLDAGIPMPTKEQWHAARKEVLWMPSIPLFESPEFKSPDADPSSKRDPKAPII